MSGNRSFDGRSYQAPTAISIHKNIPILSSYLISKPILYPFSVGAPENIGPGVGPGGTNAAKVVPLQRRMSIWLQCPNGRPPWNSDMVTMKVPTHDDAKRAPVIVTSLHWSAHQLLGTIKSRRQDQGQGWLYIWRNWAFFERQWSMTTTTRTSY